MNVVKLYSVAKKRRSVVSQRFVKIIVECAVTRNNLPIGELLSVSHMQREPTFLALCITFVFHVFHSLIFRRNFIQECNKVNSFVKKLKRVRK
jgi:hypothetical protein